MSATHRCSDARTLELSRAEEWVVHDVALARLVDEDAPDEPQPWWARGIASKLESGVRTFSPFEAWRLRRALLAYARDATTPESDAAHARSIASRLDERFDPPPKTLRDPAGPPESEA